MLFAELILEQHHQYFHHYFQLEVLQLLLGPAQFAQLLQNESKLFLFISQSRYWFALFCPLLPLPIF